MRRFAPLALAILSSPLAPSIGAADDLLSKFAVESVFASSVSANTADSQAKTSPSQRVTGAGQLGSMLRQSGYKPERIDGKAVRVTVAHGEWTIPTTVRANVGRGQIELTMGLATPKKAAELGTEKLLRLLSGAPDAGGSYFAYDADLGQIQLRQAVSARDLTSGRLARMLTEMAEMAVSRESSWYQKPARTSPEKATAPKKSPPTSSLVGSWVATMAGGEAFAIRLTQEGRFSLAHVKSGRTTTSAGRIEQEGDRLGLVGSSGLTIRGVLSGQFDLTLHGGTKLSFKRAG